MALLYKHALLVLATFTYASATTAVTSTGIAPTKTYCPRGYQVSITPSPTNFICGDSGTLAKPTLLNAYCGIDIPGLGNLPGLGQYYDGVNAYTVCYRACVRDPKCISYSVDPANGVCYTYGETLKNMAFKPDPTLYHLFYNLRGCFQCNSPPPPSRMCPLQPEAKTPLPRSYTCGQRGDFTDGSDAPYYDILSLDQPDECYRRCAESYDPVGQCTSFATALTNGDENIICFIFNKTLINQGFKRKSGGNFQAWNLRGCYDCDAPTSTVSSCKPTMTPYNVGVRNGGFQRVYTDKRSSLLKPSEWSIFDSDLDDGRVRLVKEQDGNNLIALSTYQSQALAPRDSRIFQQFYGLTGKQSRFYNFTFDVAVPSQYDNRAGTSDPACSVTLYGGSVEVAEIFANHQSLQGTRLKTVGPFVADTPDPNDEGVSFGFYALCVRRDKYSVTNATFWVDNLRITQNGVDVGGNRS